MRSNERTGSSNTSDEHVHPADRSRLDVVERLGTPSWGYLREFVERMWIGQRDPLRIRDREREVESPDEKLADEGLLSLDPVEVREHAARSMRSADPSPRDSSKPTLDPFPPAERA